jgi:SAM-dependent methyltransferase
MVERDYSAMFDLEESLWWYAGMRSITEAILTQNLHGTNHSRLLDIGCGTGFSLLWLRDWLAAQRVIGVDVSVHAAQYWGRRGLDTAAIASADALPFGSDEFDVVTSFDVLCQLNAQQVAKAVCETYRVLSPGGRLFLRVPAYDWLWGTHDKALGTKHRYSRKEIQNLLTQHGFVIERATYLNMLLFIVAAPHRLLSKFRTNGRIESDVQPVPSWLNKALLQVLEFEAWLIKHCSFPFGLSVAILAKKRVG